MKKNFAKTALAFFAIYIVWGSTYFAISVALESLPVFFISSMRFLTAGIILMVYSACKGVARPSRQNWTMAVKSGFLSFFVSFGILTWALRVLPSSTAALLISLEPACFVAIAWLFFKGPRPTRRIIIAQLIGFTGCALLIFADPVTEAANAVPKMQYMISAIAVIISGCAWVYGALLTTQGGAHADATMASGMQMFSGGAILLIVGLIGGDICQIGGATTRSFAAMLYLIFFGSIYAHSAYVYLLRTQETAKVAAHTFVNPVVAVLIGWAFGGERITFMVLLAAAFVITSVMMTVYAKPQKFS